MIVIGIDPGQCCGWAVVDSAKPRVILASGRWIYKGHPLIAAMEDIRERTYLLCVEWGAARGFVEDKPFHSGGMRANDWSAVLRTAALAGIERAGAVPVPVNPGTWKSRVCGSGKLGPPEYRKIIELLTSPCGTHDEAAARGIAMYGAAMSEYGDGGACRDRVRIPGGRDRRR